MTKTRSNKAPAKQAQQQPNGTSDSKLAKFLDPNSSWDKVIPGSSSPSHCILVRSLDGRGLIQFPRILVRWRIENWVHSDQIVFVNLVFDLENSSYE